MSKLAEIQKQYNESVFLQKHHEDLAKNFHRNSIILEGAFQQEEARLAKEKADAETSETPKEDLEEV